ncbi:MAG: TonB-dependent receptor [Luteitalea sp.]|nr:TonB-dependent receptor [Luteitalea sp.]
MRRGLTTYSCGAGMALALAALPVAWPATVHAQAMKGSLVGAVTDSTGAALPGVTVLVTETQTNRQTTAITNESGFYTVPTIANGQYQVEAELEGFKKTLRENIRVDVNTTVRADLVLEIGELTESVTVASEPALLQTDRTDTGRIIESRQVQDLPLGFNRNFQGLWVTVPGSSRPTRPHSEFFNPQDSLEAKINGQSRMSNNVQIEGIDNNQRTGLLTVLIPSPEAIETVGVSTSNFDAELGRAGGAVTSVTLKSGTNQLSGSAFWFGKDDAMNARPYFAETKAPTTYNQFGFTLGGPIVQNRLFYFGDYQRTNDDLGKVHRLTVPPAEWRNGDFSSAPTTIYDPATGNPDGSGRAAFSGNRIPQSRISPIAQRLLDLVPAPNLDAAPGQINYEATAVREKRTDNFDTKITYQASPADQIAWRLSFMRPEIFDPSPEEYGLFGGPSNGGFNATGSATTWSTTFNWTRSLSNTLVLDTRAGLSRYHNIADAQGRGLRSSEELGITGANLDDYTSGLTSINLNNGYSNPALGFGGSLPWDRSERTVQLASTLTKLLGNHAVKIGADYRYNRDFLLQTQDNGGPRGIFRFTGAGTAIPTDAAATAGVANTLASFLLDQPNSIGRDNRVVDPVMIHQALFTFIHDKWQVTPRTTLDLGLRHEFYTPFYAEEAGGLSNFDPETNTLRVAGYGNVPSDVGVEKSFTHFSPRVGLSYRIDDRTVARGGYGATTIPFPDNKYAWDNFPVKQNNQFSAPNAFQTPGLQMADGFPAPLVAEIPDDGIIDASDPALLNQGYNVVPLDLEEATLHTWNVAFQRELTWGFVGEVAYVGNYGDGVLSRLQANAGMVLGAEDAGRPYFERFGRTAESRVWVPTTSRYDGLQVKLDRRFSNGFLMTNSYTLGKSTDYSNDNAFISTPADRERSKGPSAFDRRHAYSASFVYELPFGREDEGLVRWLAGGWQLAGVFTAMTGTPVDIDMSGATLGAPNNTQRPNMVSEPRIIGDIGPEQQYFDPSAFEAPPAATWGNLTRNGSGVTGPAFVNLDLTLAKRFAFGARFLELRIDSFNLTNSPHFNNPENTLGDADFGQVTGAFGERQFQLGAKFVF